MLTLAGVSIRDGARDPLFSVIVPVGDRPALLGQTLATVLGQTVRDLEVLVVVADGDVSGAGAGAAPAVPADPRLRVIGCAAASRSALVDAGLAAAQGRYVALIVEGDLWVPHRLELALAGLARAPIAICGSRAVDEVPSRRGGLDRDPPPLAATALDLGALHVGAIAPPARDGGGPSAGAIALVEGRVRSLGAMATIPEVGALLCAR